MLKDLDKNIILSLSYTHQFQYPLTLEEIHLRLLGASSIVSLSFLKKTLNKLIKQNKVFYNKGFYFLSNGEKNINLRLKREKYSLLKYQDAKNFVNFAKKIPWVMGVAITGSLAVNNAKKNDDIDFLIVTKKNRLWLSRIILTLFSFYKRKKRSWKNHEKNSWCLNLWLDENSLKLPKKLKNVYGAFEVSQAVWMFDKNDIKSVFFKLNSWAREYLPNYFDFQKNSKLKSIKFNDDLLVIGILLNIIDDILFIFQYVYMKPHMTREKVSKQFAFFHPRNTKKQVFYSWIKKIKQEYNENYE